MQRDRMTSLSLRSTLDCSSGCCCTFYTSLMEGRGQSEGDRHTGFLSKRSCRQTLPPFSPSPLLYLFLFFFPLHFPSLLRLVGPHHFCFPSAAEGSLTQVIVFLPLPLVLFSPGVFVCTGTVTFRAARLQAHLFWPSYACPTAKFIKL